MSIKTRRTDMGWTQEQPAQHAGLSTRTVQRLEQGQAATLESLKCLAAVFDTNVKTLIEEQDMTHTSQTNLSGTAMDSREQEAIEYVQDLKWFLIHLMLAGMISAVFVVMNITLAPGVWWSLYAILGWAVGLAAHAIYVFGSFGLFGPDWEQRQFRKRMRQFD